MKGTDRYKESLQKSRLETQKLMEDCVEIPRVGSSS